MIEVSDSATQSYVLPLENIDLTHLSKNFRNTGEKVPLWSKRQLDGELGYYEIKIAPQTFDEDDCYFEPSETYKCHICNIEVPTIFYKEHNNSLKHKKIKNIFEEVLERLSKHINLNIDSNCKDNNQETYYCVPCSKTVNRKNKFKHEETDYHKNSLKNIHIINDFHEIFTEIDNNNGKINQSLNSMEDFEKDAGCNTPPAIIPHLDSDTNNFDNFNDSLLNAVQEFNNLTMNPQEYSPERATRNEVSFETYLRNVKVKYNIIIDLPKVQGEYVYIVNTQGVKVEIPQASYQGYQYLVNQTYCVLCSEWLENTETHDEEESHIRNFLKPVDENFARVISASVSHCLVCNEPFLSKVDSHWRSDKHKKSLQNKVIQLQTPQCTDDTKPKKTLCDFCNVSIDTHNFLGHTNSKKHKNNKTKFLISNNISKINANVFLCGVCNVLIDPNTLKGHVNSSAHVSAKVSKLNSEYCHVCLVDVPKGGMEIHTKGNPHRMKISQNNKNTAQNGNSCQNNHSTTSTSTSSLSTTSNSTNTPEIEDKFTFYNKFLIYSNNGGKITVKCRICNVQIPHVRRNIIEHVEGWLHKQETNAFKKLLIFVDDSQTRVSCKICNVNIPYVERNITEHMVGKLHEAEESELLQFHTIKKQGFDYVCDCCDERFRNYWDHINSDSHTRTYQTEKVIDKGLMRKYVYEIDASHGTARIYENLYKKLIQCNEIIKLNESTFYCQFCGIRFGRISEIDHMLGERHRQNIESTEEESDSDD